MSNINAPALPGLEYEASPLPMLRDRATRAKACILAVAVGLNLWALSTLPSRVTFAEVWWAPLPTIVILAAAGMFCTYQKWTRVGMYFCALAWVASSGLSEIHALYAVGTKGGPLADNWLANIDAALGFCVADVKALADSVPFARNVLAVLYDGIIVQTFLVMLLLSLKRDQISLNRFIIGFMICEPILLFSFWLMPAAGPFAHYGYEMTPMQALYLSQLEALRGTEALHVAFPTGLVTFPSFHTTWAILLAYAVRKHRGWFAFGMVINALIVLATLTTGWHFLADVIGGALLAVVVIVLCHLICPPVVKSEPA
ncbi:MAG: phosphatase PAP2 family protein [Phycisphaerae bacterium]